jgi:hypothetical protein
MLRGNKAERQKGRKGTEETAVHPFHPFSLSPFLPFCLPSPYCPMPFLFCIMKMPTAASVMPADRNIIVV